VAGLAQAPSVPSESSTFRVESTQVQLDVQVLVRQRPVANLEAVDFQIFDEGAPCAITYFSHESASLRLLILLDVSGSMRKQVRQMAETARQALNALRDGDQVAVMAFARRAEILESFTPDRHAMEAAIRRACEIQDLGAGTAMNESLLAAASHFPQTAATTPERRAILILTDNQGLNYLCPDTKVIAALLTRGIVLNAIVMANTSQPKRRESLAGLNPDFTPPDVFGLASETGGEALRSDRAGKSFPEILERIRTRYLIYYTPPPAPPGMFRHVRVELSPQAARRYGRAEIRVRSGYYTTR